jgi:hypothetical protein
MTVLLIPILGISCGLLAIIGGTIVKPWLALKQQRMELDARLLSERTGRNAASVERLEQRMRVLERIVTDKGIDVADEIERLRDPVN